MKRKDVAALALPEGVNPHAVRPYGDALDDGLVQVSFTLPVPLCPESVEAARRLGGQMGLKEPTVYHQADLGHGFSFYILYGRLQHAVDFGRIVVPRVSETHVSFDEINARVQSVLGRRIRVVGACTGSDAHTVGIDAIMNMKGYDGEYGLERYPQFDARNLGSQVPNEVLLRQIVELDADAVLVSQVVTQRDVHLDNLAELADMIEAQGMRDRIVLVCGGPRITHEVALELGYDAGFGAGTRPSQVASFLADEVIRRKA